MTKKTIVRYVLTVAPDMAHVKKGMWTTQTFNHYEDAYYLARAFEKMGAVWYLETIETTQFNARGSCDAINEWWGE